MKKILVFLALVGFITPTYAFMMEGKTSDADVLRKSGTSEATIEIIDTVKRNNDYGYNHHDSAYPEVYPVGAWENTRMWYEKIKDYIDPCQDDGYFGRHEISFSNKFFFMQPNQSPFKKDAHPKRFKVNNEAL